MRRPRQFRDSLRWLFGPLVLRPLLAIVIFAHAIVSSAESKLEIVDEVILDSGAAAAAHSMVSDGGAVTVIGERNGKPGTGPEILVTKLDAVSLRVRWRTAVPAGAPLPSSIFPTAILLGRQGGAYVFASVNICDVDAATGKCNLRGPRRRELQVIKLDDGGSVEWRRSLLCGDLECRADRLVGAIALPDGMLLIRAIVIAPSDGSEQGRGARLVQKIGWDASPMWQKTVSAGLGVPSRIERLDAQFFFAEMKGKDTWMRTFDANGDFRQPQHIGIPCMNGSLHGLDAAFVLFCPTDLYKESGAALGAKMAFLTRDMRIDRDRRISIISSANLIARTGGKLVVLGSSRDQIGARPRAAGAVLDEATGATSSLRFDRFRNASALKDARQSQADEFLALYDASDGLIGTVEKRVAVLARLKLESTGR